MLPAIVLCTWFNEPEICLKWRRSGDVNQKRTCARTCPDRVQASAHAQSETPVQLSFNAHATLMPSKFQTWIIQYTVGLELWRIRGEGHWWVQARERGTGRQTARASRPARAASLPASRHFWFQLRRGAHQNWLRSGLKWGRRSEQWRELRKWDNLSLHQGLT